MLVKATPDTPVHSPLLRCCNISFKRVEVGLGMGLGVGLGVDLGVGVALEQGRFVPYASYATA